MMKKFILGLTGVMLVIFWAMSCQVGKRDAESIAKDEDVSEKTASKIILSSEDSMLCVEVFESYLDYKKLYVDSACVNCEQIKKNAGEWYLQNKEHIDSVLHECIGLVRQRNYDQLLARLEKERMQIYSHPGDVIDNEIGLDIIFRKLYNQRYYESKDSFYMKVLPIYEFTKLHMETLEVLGSERHPLYNDLTELIKTAEKWKK